MDIISLPIKYDNEDIDGSFRMVIASVMRAKDLSQGALPATSSKAQKITTLAIEEVAAGAVKVLTGEEAVKAIEESKKLTHKKFIDEAQQKEAMPEDASELEKDLKIYLTEKSQSEQKKTLEDIFGEE
jgi:DNA-directed RNA polymerase subunit K/omega